MATCVADISTGITKKGWAEQVCQLPVNSWTVLKICDFSHLYVSVHYWHVRNGYLQTDLKILDFANCPWIYWWLAALILRDISDKIWSRPHFVNDSSHHSCPCVYMQLPAREMSFAVREHEGRELSWWVWVLWFGGLGKSRSLWLTWICITRGWDSDGLALWEIIFYFSSKVILSQC